MLIVYEPVFQAPKEGKDNQPRLFAGTSGMGVMVSLSTDSFHIEYKEGKAEVHLARHLTAEECRALGQALIDTADNNDRMHAEWVAANEALNAEEVDPSNPIRPLRGTFR